ncbi:MAG: aminotransferase class I/II-fold pyridoxal phosphate-dependent enzyme [Epsilonproteobacteria bacterium]|nr:aminotransferase class I/II-fold pyridoxal phosphate-dependent enzyme [Campylobacterota bacterium]
MIDFEYFHTLLPQAIGAKNGPIAPTITPSAAFGYADAQEAEGIFCGDVAKPLYARMGNPTNAKLESVLAKIDDADSALVTASGMGALSMVLTAFLNSGDKVLCIGGFFGGTYALMTETLPRLGITASFCQTNDFEKIEERLKKDVAIVVIESISNPSLNIPDIEKIADLCNHYNTLLLVDNTVTPLLIQPLKMGADIIIYSTTKNISGHSGALGGAALFRSVTPNDKLKAPKYVHLHKIINKMGTKAMLAICKKRAMRDYGMSANAFGSFITMLGLETLSLRIERVSKSAEIIALALDKALVGIKVIHPALTTHPDHALYQKLYPQGAGSLLALDVGDKARAFKLINATKLVTQTANIGDNRTLALHMKSTIFRDFDTQSWEILGITDGLIRISVGLENPQDIIDDFITAAKTI